MLVWTSLEMRAMAGLRGASFICFPGSHPCELHAVGCVFFGHSSPGLMRGPHPVDRTLHYTFPCHLRPSTRHRYCYWLLLANKDAQGREDKHLPKLRNKEIQTQADFRATTLDAGLKASLCLHVSKPNKTGTGFCTKESKSLFLGSGPHQETG